MGIFGEFRELQTQDRRAIREGPITLDVGTLEDLDVLALNKTEDKFILDAHIQVAFWSHPGNHDIRRDTALSALQAYLFGDVLKYLSGLAHAVDNHDDERARELIALIRDKCTPGDGG